jgi:hypothetical protein
LLVDQVLKNGVILRGLGYGEIVDIDDDDAQSFYSAESRYGRGPFLLVKKEMLKIGRRR